MGRRPHGPNREPSQPATAHARLYDVAVLRDIELSDTELGSLLFLIESTQDDPGPTKDEQINYIRTWAFTLEELAAVVMLWAAEGISIPTAWSSFLGSDTPPNTMAYIRYLGETRGKAAHTRFVENFPHGTMGALQRLASRVRSSRHLA
ncbi:BQ2448_2063 [Microbotryum intermedium]|uniref:BQ2448_2063 protein n=1 Tax=Microbotryum intermedium TaxID=269621 RepID=A0A238FAJ5_9BASI|nr:BQ2448_2063 [Microbotryum intermedium]